MPTDIDLQATSRLAAQARGRDLDLEVAHPAMELGCCVAAA
jgi:hypothetical protein